jgi:hypothetical protein
VMALAVQNGVRERRVVRREGGEYAQIPEIDEAVNGSGVIGVLADDLAQAVDAVRFRGEIDVPRIDDERIAVADFDEAEPCGKLMNVPAIWPKLLMPSGRVSPPLASGSSKLA